MQGPRIREGVTQKVAAHTYAGSVMLEAPPGFEPGMEVLQTSALPLGDGAADIRDRSLPSRMHKKARGGGLMVDRLQRPDPDRRSGKVERETGFEPATSTLARSHSTTELFPPTNETLV